MNLSKTVIYIVNDDDRYLMRRFFQEIDPPLTSIEVESGSELLTMLRIWSRRVNPQPAHLILLDMNMPRVNGLETLRAIRSNLLQGHIPAVMISTSAEPEQAVTVYQNAISGYLKSHLPVRTVNRLPGQ